MRHVRRDRKGGHALISLMRSASVIPPCTRSQPVSSKLPVWEKIVCHGVPDKLTISTTRIWGLEYIASVSLGGQSSGIFIPIEARGVRGIRFALGMYGLRAIKVVYKDGSMSPWLGSTTFAWYGKTTGCDLRQLWVLSDVGNALLRCTRISTYM